MTSARKLFCDQDSDDFHPKESSSTIIVHYVAGHGVMTDMADTSYIPAEAGGLKSLHGLHQYPPSRAGPANNSSFAEARQIVGDVHKQLKRCLEDIEQVKQESTRSEKRANRSTVTVSTITIRLLAACLSELLKLERPQSHRDYCPDLCRLLDCPQQPVLRWAVGHAIGVLQRTRGKFKSKELAELRVSLERLLENSAHFAPTC